MDRLVKEFVYLDVLHRLAPVSNVFELIVVVEVPVIAVSFLELVFHSGKPFMKSVVQFQK
jgi:hypothetical protein